jgi:hypothetical protein
MKSTSVWGNIKKDWWVVIGLLVLVLAIVIGLILVAYFWTRDEPSCSKAIEPFVDSPKYPFTWMIYTNTSTNEFKYVDKNNGVKHIAQFKKNNTVSSLDNNNVTSINTILDSEKQISGTVSIDALTPIINLNSANKEFIQILPSAPDTLPDYEFVRPTTVGTGFTIAMWVKFPDVRKFNTTGQSECLVEIFKNQKDGKDGAWKSAGTNWGGYFHIVRRSDDNSKLTLNDNNKIVTGFLGKSVVGPVINDYKWHHIAVSVELTSSFVKNNGKYKIALYVDGNKTSQEFTVTDKDQIFMGTDAEFNIGKFTRGISNGEQYGYANMSFTGLQLHNRVLGYYEIMQLTQKNDYIKYVSSSIPKIGSYSASFGSAYINIGDKPYLLFTAAESAYDSFNVNFKTQWENANNTFNKKNTTYLKDFGIVKTTDTPNVYVFALENYNTFKKSSGHVNFTINNADFSSNGNCIATIKQSDSQLTTNSFNKSGTTTTTTTNSTITIYKTLSYGLTNYPVVNIQPEFITFMSKQHVEKYYDNGLNLSNVALLNTLKKQITFDVLLNKQTKNAETPITPQIPFQHTSNPTSYLLFNPNYITSDTGNAYIRSWDDNATEGRDHSIWYSNTTGYIYGNVSNEKQYDKLVFRNTEGQKITNNQVNKKFTDFMSLTFSDDKTEKLDASTGLVNLYFMDNNNKRNYIGITENTHTITYTPSSATQFTEYVFSDKKLSKYTTKINSNVYILGFDYINGDNNNSLKLYKQDKNSSLDYSSYDSIIPIKFDDSNISSMNSSNQIHNNKRPWYIFDNSGDSTVLHGKGALSSFIEFADNTIKISDNSDNAIKLVAEKYTKPVTTSSTTTTTKTQPTTTTTTTEPTTTSSTTTTTTTEPTTTSSTTTTTTTLPTTTSSTTTTTTTTQPTTTTTTTQPTTTTTTTQPTTTTTTTQPTTTTTQPTTTTTQPTTTTTTIPEATRATNIYGNANNGSYSEVPA